MLLLVILAKARIQFLIVAYKGLDPRLRGDDDELIIENPDS
jgi:hypothetical protein